MRTSTALGAALLVSTALTAPTFAQTSTPAPSAQTSPATEASTQLGGDASDSESDSAGEDVDISIPGGSSSQGGDIVVTGRFIPNVVKATPQVVSVLSSADIARTGEGDIAGALQRVTGLSVVGEGFVYVRGLGDRYSLSLLNGSPLPSPDPLKRVVPLDIFPSSLIASGLVQKSYSPNFPGEYGGGVINLTTQAIPTESFVKVGGSLGYDTETTRKLGYTYYGSKSDWTGYDSGTRDVPDFVKRAAANPFSSVPSAEVAALSNSRTTVLQRNFDTPVNWSADISAGTNFEIGGDATVGLIAAGGISNSWLTRDALRETADDAGSRIEAFDVVSTDNRILVNGLVGLGLELGDHKFRLTNVYIHDTLKQGRLESGFSASFPEVAGQPDPQIVQGTSWVERQLYDLQGAAELRFGDLGVDLRGTYANTKRKSPYEREFSYLYSDTFDAYTNNLSGGPQNATITFSDLNEDLYGAGADVSYDLPTARPIKVTAGYAYTETQRSSSRYQFRYSPLGGDDVGNAISQLRPDLLVSSDVVLFRDLQLLPNNALGAVAYDASLLIHAGYGMAEAELIDGLRVSGGVRYETSEQAVVPSGGFSGTRIDSDYWLPSLTVTWNFRENMQVRLHGSKTIARPQFRELAQQQYQDFSTNRTFFGNPALTNSELINFEARYEWFFARDQRFSVAAFYKDIDSPIETIANYDSASGELYSLFGNAPKAKLYGVEFEFQKYIPLDTLLSGEFFSTKRLVAIANYTYAQSELEVGGELIPDPFPVAEGDPRGMVPASNYFVDGAPMTGQSDHLVNLQLGIEDTERLMQLTFLVNYASERVTLRGPRPQPDFVEKPGVTFDIVYRQGFEVLGREIEVKAEARNLLSTNYEETQSFEGGATYSVNSYDRGPTFSLGASLKF